MSIISAKAILTAEDQTGAVFDKVAAKFDKLAKSTKSAENVQRLTQSLKGAQEQLKAIDKFDLARGRFASVRAQFRETQIGVEKAARAMAAAEKPTRQMEMAYKRAQTAVSNASRAFEEQKAAVIGATRALQISGTPLNRIASEQARLRTHVERTTRALHQQNQIVERSPANTIARRSGSGGGTMKAIGETGAIYEGTRAIKYAAGQGADLIHERVRMQAAGMSPQEIEAAEGESSRLSKKYLPVSQTQIMHLLRNTRSIVGNYHEAAEVADPLLALRVVAQGAHPDKAEELDADFDKLQKGMEIKGVTQNLPKYRHYIDNMSKAVNVFGDTLRPTDYYEMFKYGRASTNALSDDFMLSTSPTLAQELGGSSSGKALSSFHTQFVGGKMSQVAAEALNDHGFLDPKKIIRTSTGAIKGVKPGGILIGREFLKTGQEDPYRWTQAAIAQFEKTGVDPSEMQEMFTSIASQTTTAQMLNIFATQQARIEKDKALIKGAKGIDAANDFMRSDPKIGVQSILTQGNNILANATAPAVTQFAPVMYSAASSLAQIAGLAKDHPALSTAASGGIFSGLMAGGAKGASMLLPWIFGNAPEGGMAKVLTSTLGTTAKWGARGGGWTTAAMIAWDAYQNREELGRDVVGRGEHAQTGDPWQAGYDRDHPAGTLDELRRQRDERDARRAAIHAGYDGFPTMTYGTGVGGDKSITVSGSVTGNGEMKIIVEAGSSLLQVVEQANAAIRLVGQINSNGPGSTGQSSPDAAAPARPSTGSPFSGY